MSRMWAMIVKEFRQLRRDHRTVAMMVVMPLLLLVVFGYAASFDVDSVPTVVVGERAEAVAGELPDLFDVTEVNPEEDAGDAVETLRDGEAVVAVVAQSSPRVLVDGAELFSAQAVQGALARAPQAPQPEILFNPSLDTSVIMVPALAGLILVFVGTLITSLGVVRERQSGTLEQLAVMPFRARDVFVGKIAPYFVVAAIDLTVIVIVGGLLFNVPFRGSIATFALGALLFLFVTLGLGILISSVSENQGQAIQLAMMTLLPQVLLSGLIFPLSSMPAGVSWISYFLPLTYFNQIARGVMVRGAPIESLWEPLALLAILGAVVFGLAVVRFRSDLTPARGRSGGGRTTGRRVPAAEGAR
jgi:ABC-2 type transport system permease protein